MSLTITLIDPDQSIDLGPDLLNDNFTAIKVAIDEIQSALILGTSMQLKLTSLIPSLPNNSIEAATAVLTGNSGNLLSFNPGGGVATYTVSFDGRISGLNATLTGVGADRSSIAELLVTTISEFDGKMTVKDELSLVDANSVVTTKSTIKTITTANIGAAATTPLDCSKDNFLLLDCDNGGSPLAIFPAEAIIKLDTTTLKEGQKIRYQLLRQNVYAQKFYNGGIGTEVFAKILPSAGGFVSLSSASLPAMDPTGGDEVWLDCQWIQISAAVFRLVILGSSNILGI